MGFSRSFCAISSVLQIDSPVYICLCANCLNAAFISMRIFFLPHFLLKILPPWSILISWLSGCHTLLLMFLFCSCYFLVLFSSMFPSPWAPNFRWFSAQSSGLLLSPPITFWFSSVNLKNVFTPGTFEQKFPVQPSSHRILFSLLTNSFQCPLVPQT